MDSIVLYNQSGQKFDVEVVRYFENAGNKYLIFSLNEIDANGYMQLYLSKVTEVDGKKNMLNVTDESEWTVFRSAIQKIVTNNRNNIPNEGDLDYKELDGSMVSEFRIFKLKNEVAKVLSSNKNLKSNVEESDIKTVDTNSIQELEPRNLQDASAQNTGMTIEEILKKVSEGAKNARETTKVELDSPKHTIDDLLNSVQEAMPAQNDSVEEIVPKPIETTELSVAEDSKINENEAKAVSETFRAISEPLVQESDTTDYKTKYDEALLTMRRLEEENMRLINDLIDAKAKIETIKDILN